MENKRAFFRLDLNVEPIKITFSENDEKVKESARLRDISAGGLSVYTDKNVKLKKEDSPFQFDLIIFEEYFSLEGKLVRVETTEDNNIYAFEFINITEERRKQLVAKMLQFDIKKRRM